MLGYDEELELIKDDVKVAWINLGEGFQGDYDENDPEDENLLRFDVYVKEDGDWVAVDDASYCTQVSAKTSNKDLNRLLGVLMDNFYDALHNQHYISVKKLGEQMSWISNDLQVNKDEDMEL